MNPSFFRYAPWLVIIYSLLVHLPGIHSPLLDEQSYRQCQTALMARNFARNGMHFFSPEVYSPGVHVRMGTEFPAYSYIVALLYKVAGEHDSLGRLVSMIFAAWGALFLYWFIVPRLGVFTAFWSALAMCTIPVHVFYTRTFQPEAMALWGVLGFTFLWDQYQRENRLRVFFGAIALGVIASGLKLPYIYVIVSLGALLVWDHQPATWWKNPSLYIGVGMVGILTAAWYAYARTAPAQILPLTAGYHLENLRPLLSWKFYKQQFISRLPEIYMTYPGLLLVGVGAWSLRGDKKFFLAWWAASFAYLISLGHYLTFSAYAGLPLAPIHGVLIGSGITVLWKQWRGKKRWGLLLLVAGIPLHTVLRIHQWYTLDETFVLRAKVVVQRLTQPRELLMTQTSLHPVLLYYFDRPGFAVDLEGEPLSSIDEAQRLGARWFVTGIEGRWARHPEWARYLASRADLIYTDPEFLIYRYKIVNPSPGESSFSKIPTP